MAWTPLTRHAAYMAPLLRDGRMLPRARCRALGRDRRTEPRVESRNVIQDQFMRTSGQTVSPPGKERRRFRRMASRADPFGQ